MSFFGYRSSSSSKSAQKETHLSELERLRGRQLASLVRAGGRAKNQQQTVFEVAIADTSRGPLTLVLTLPTEFPVKVPCVKASMPLQHRWLDAVGNVQGHPDLINWSAHSDLGRIVTEIVTELRVMASSVQASSKPPASPAMNGSASAAASASLSPAVRGSQILNYPSPSGRQSPQVQQPQAQPSQKPESSKMQHTQMPVIPAVFPELEELSSSQLEKLASDSHALKKFVHELRSVKEFKQLRDDVMHSNMAIANKTLDYESELRELQAEVQQQREELRAAQEALAEKQARQQRIISRHRPDALLEQLEAATKDVDNASDDVATQFAHGDLDVAEFISTYLPQRSLYHERTLKLARVHQH